jgi:hypothetical protein
LATVSAWRSDVWIKTYVTNTAVCPRDFYEIARFSQHREADIKNRNLTGYPDAEIAPCRFSMRGAAEEKAAEYDVDCRT